jgi:predicted ferric reductase
LPKKSLSFILFFSNLAVIVGFWFWNNTHQALGNLLTGESSGLFLALGRLAGFLAMYLVLWQLLLIGRIRWVERWFGLDRLSRIHHWNGFLIIWLLVAHGVLVTSSYAAQEGIGFFAQLVSFAKEWEDLPAAMIAFGLFLMVAGCSMTIVRKRWPYEFWFFTHLFSYLAIGLMIAHQFEHGGDLVAHPWFAAYARLLYVLTFGNFLWFRWLRPTRFFLRHRFVVDRVICENPQVTSVYIRGRRMDAFRVSAGQFTILRFLAPGFRWEAHPFSVSAFPSGKEIRVTIKGVGDFTSRVSRLKPGTPVFVDGPYGVFTADRARKNSVALIAGGIGITPLRALAEDLLSRGKQVVLFNSNRRSADIVFGQELERLSSKGELTVVNALTEDPSWTGEKGRIDAGKIQRFCAHPADWDFYLCGPPPMMRGLLGILKSLGVPQPQVHYERFSL